MKYFVYLHLTAVVGIAKFKAAFVIPYHCSIKKDCLNYFISPPPSFCICSNVWVEEGEARLEGCEEWEVFHCSPMHMMGNPEMVAYTLKCYVSD